MGSSQAKVTKVAGLEDIAVGIVGTGMMGTAHAKAWTRVRGLPERISSFNRARKLQRACLLLTIFAPFAQLGMTVFIGSRDAARGAKAAASIGNGCAGGGHAEMLEKSNFVLLCIKPGPPSVQFVDSIKEQVKGKGKSFVDMSASYTRYCSDRDRAPPPYKSHLNYLKDRLDDPSSSWVKAWANVMYTSISNFNRQPMEVAGDPKAKETAFRMLTAAGFEPLDCGTAEDAMKIEPISAPFNRPERWRHPRHLEFNGPNHP